MANKAKKKGTAAETAVVNYLTENGFTDAHRVALHGNKDMGDVAFITQDGRSVCVEVKNTKEIPLSNFVTQAITERENSGSDLGFCVAKRPRKGSPGDWYVLLTLDELLRFIN